MIDAAANDALDALAACPCCLLGPQQRCLKTPYTHLDNTEIYSDMLKECFNIQLDVGTDECGICEECVVRLRDASHFKRQVQRSQRELQERLARAIKITEEAPPAVVKLEMPDEDGASDDLLGEEIPDEMAGNDEVRQSTSTREELDVKSEAADLDGASDNSSGEEPDVKSEAADEDGASDNSLVEQRRAAGEPETARDAASDEDPISLFIQIKLEPMTEVDVKLEPLDEWGVSLRESERETGSCSGEVKNEPAPDHEPLPTVSPSHLNHQASVNTAILQAAQASDVEQQPSPRDCVKRERSDGREDQLGETRRGTAESRRGVEGNMSAGAGKPSRKRKRTVSKTFCCGICKKKFARSSNLKAHERTHTGEKPYTCEVCKQQFAHSSNLKVHERIHTGNKPYVCQICNRKYSQLSNLKKHERSHTGEKPFVCGICKKQFRTSSNLIVHERIHTGEKPYICVICKQQFAQMGNLKIHERIHTGEKPHTCGICKQEFTQIGTLKIHRRTHTGEKPYCCGICNKMFSELGNLKKHRQIHTGEKPYCCEICNKKFTALGNLTAHRQIHTGEKSYWCDKCQKGFIRKDKLLSHILTCKKKGHL